jgi:hypothetical protein
MSERGRNDVMREMRKLLYQSFTYLHPSLLFLGYVSSIQKKFEKYIKDLTLNPVHEQAL